MMMMVVVAVVVALVRGVVIDLLFYSNVVVPFAGCPGTKHIGS